MNLRQVKKMDVDEWKKRYFLYKHGTLYHKSLIELYSYYYHLIRRKYCVITH